MSKLLFYVFFYIFFANWKSAVCNDSNIVMNIDNMTVDLQSYLSDLQVSAVSSLYTANLTLHMINELQDRLTKKEVSCQCGNDRPIENIGKSEILRSSYKGVKSGFSLYMFHKGPLTWNDARKSCKNQGGQLADVDNARDFRELSESLNEKSNLNQGTPPIAFIGIHSFFGKNDWLTLSGQSVSQLKHLVWSSSADETSVSNSCAAMTANATITAVDCNRRLPYLCKSWTNW